MKYILALFTGKVIVEKNKKAYYYDPVSKNIYKLEGSFAKRPNLLSMRIAIAIFAFLVLYSIWPTVLGFDSTLIFMVVALIGLIVFEVRLYTKILPSFAMYPKHKLNIESKSNYSKSRTLTLIIAYSVLIVTFLIYIYQQATISIFIGSLLLCIVAVVRIVDLVKELQNTNQ